MTEDEELAYEAGRLAALLQLLRQILKALGRDAPQWSETARLLLEREEAVAALRTLCKEHCDNEWPDDLHLADVIDKHLGQHLRCR